jgi:hypothetical protein
MITNTNGWQIPPLCKIQGCELPSQIYSKISINSKNGIQYLKTCRRHTYRDVKKVEKDS